MAFFLWKFKVVKKNHHHFKSSQLWTSSKSTVQIYFALCTHIIRHFFFLLVKKQPITINTPRAQKLLPELKHGGIILTAHLGYWEWMGAYLTQNKVPLVASYLPPTNKLAHKTIKHLRNRWGFQTINHQSNPQYMR